MDIEYWKRQEWRVSTMEHNIVFFGAEYMWDTIEGYKEALVRCEYRKLYFEAMDNLRKKGGKL